MFVIGNCMKFIVPIYRGSSWLCFIKECGGVSSSGVKAKSIGGKSGMPVEVMYVTDAC